MAFLRAAELLLESDPRLLAWSAMFVNLGLAIELGLKGFFREKGGSEEQQVRLGHDLVATYQVVCAQGFRPPRPLCETLITEVNLAYKNMSLRYLVGTKLDLPHVGDAIIVTRELLLALHEQA